MGMFVFGMAVGIVVGIFIGIAALAILSMNRSDEKDYMYIND